METDDESRRDRTLLLITSYLITQSWNFYTWNYSFIRPSSVSHDTNIKYQIQHRSWSHISRAMWAQCAVQCGEQHLLTNMRTERSVRTWRSQPMFLPADLAYHVMLPSLLPAVTPRPHTGHTLAGFHNLLFIDSVLFCQVINILDFSFRDCGLKQKAGLYYGQMARQENLRH